MEINAAGRKVVVDIIFVFDDDDDDDDSSISIISKSDSDESDEITDDVEKENRRPMMIIRPNHSN